MIVVPYASQWLMFPISRDPPEGGTRYEPGCWGRELVSFPISRDPPEGGTRLGSDSRGSRVRFPISRDPPEGGTFLK